MITPDCHDSSTVRWTWSRLLQRTAPGLFVLRMCGYRTVARDLTALPVLRSYPDARVPAGNEHGPHPLTYDELCASTVIAAGACPPGLSSEGGPL